MRYARSKRRANSRLAAQIADHEIVICQRHHLMASYRHRRNDAARLGANIMAVLQDLTKDQLIAMLQAKEAAPRDFKLKVTEKGCIGVFGPGLNYRGHYFYAQQWETIYAHAAEINAFIKANAATLSRK